MSAWPERLDRVQAIVVPTWLRVRARSAGTVGICALTATLGLWGLGGKSLWHDEAFSHAIARLTFPSMWDSITSEESFSGLYYVLLHLWERWGQSEIWLRLPSVVFGLLAAYSLFVLNRRLFGAATAAIASILLAINSYFVQYQQEARTYTLALFLVVLATYLFVVALDHRSTRAWMGYGGVCALAIYAHFFSAFVIGAHLISLTISPSRPRLRHLFIAYGLTAALITPLLVVAENAGSLQRAFIEEPNLGSFEWLFLHLTGAGGVATREGHLLLLAYFVICATGVFFLSRTVLRRREYPLTQRAWASGLVLLWLSVPVLGAFAVSSIRPIFLPRYLIVALPGLVSIAAVGISSLSHRGLQAIALAAVIVLSITPLTSYYRADFKEGQDWKSAVAYVVHLSRPGDGAVFLSRYGRRPFEYYLESYGAQPQADLNPIYPGVGWGEYVPVLADLNVESTATAAARLESGYERVWVILVWRGFASINEDGRPLETALEDDYREVVRRPFGPSLQVRLYARASG
jgi:mannosyltransferase